jgi:hypothetical protein
MQTNPRWLQAGAPVGAEREATLKRLKSLSSPPGLVFTKAQAKVLARDHWAGLYVRVGDIGPEGVGRFARYFPFRWRDDDDRYEVLTCWAAEFMDNKPIDLAERRRKALGLNETASNDDALRTLGSDKA